MQFTVGQTVVHPQHGPSTVTEILTRSIQGVSTSYVELHVHRTDLRIAVPVDKAEEVGLRAPRSADELEDLWRVLRNPTLHEEEQWSRRMKDNNEKLRVGELLMAAEVVRDLTRRQEARGLSAGEKDLLKQARHPLVVEVGLSLSLTDEEAEAMLDQAIHGDAVEASSAALAAIG